MRRIAAGAVGAAVVLGAAAPADAREISFDTRVRATGAFTVSWHGDPARGCAAAGLCGYRGSVQARPGSHGQLSFLTHDGRLVAAYGSLALIGTPVVRVLRDEQDGSRAACVDLAPAAELGLSLARAGRGRLRMGVEGFALAGGRCAGPDVAALVERLPTRRVVLSRLRTGGTTVDLSGTVPFVSGRFSGTVTSTLALHIGRGRETGVSTRGPPDGGRPARSRLVRLAEVYAVYRVTGLTGKFATAFRGLDAPLCESLDACGVAGASSWSILSSQGSVALEAEAFVRPSDHGLRGAIAAIERGRAFLATYGSFRHALGTATSDVTRPDGAACHDTATIEAPALAGTIGVRRFDLLLGGEDAYPSPPNLLRTGCPGPSQEDAVRRSPIAAASLPAAVVEHRRVGVRLAGDGRLRQAAYAGTWRSGFGLELERIALKVSYRTVRIRR